MNLKTLDKSDAIHVLNLVSIVMAWGVTCYFFDAVVTNNAMEMFGDVLMWPVYLTDHILNTFTHYTVSGNFNLMFLVLWASYALPITAFYPLLMVKNHDPSELKEWYLTRGDHHLHM